MIVRITRKPKMEPLWVERGESVWGLEGLGGMSEGIGRECEYWDEWRDV